MKMSEDRSSSVVSGEKNITAENPNSAFIQIVSGHPSADDDEDGQSIEIAALKSPSKKTKKKKEKERKSRKSKKATDGTDECVCDVASPSLKKKKKKDKTTKDGKNKSKKIKKESQSQSSCSASSDFEISLSSMETFGFDDVSVESDQDSCYKSTTGNFHTPVGIPKQKLAFPSSAPLDIAQQQRPRSPSAAVMGAWLPSPKESDPPIGRRAIRRASAGGASMLLNSYHGSTPTSTEKLAAKIQKSLHERIEKTLHDSMPDLFASPGGVGLDKSPLGGGGRGRRRMLKKHDSMPDVFASSPGRVVLDASSAKTGRRRRPLKPFDNNDSEENSNVPWTPRAPTLARRLSSKSLMDELGNSSVTSFVSGSDSSLDDPFKSSTQQDKPQAPAPLSIPDLFGDSSDDDDDGCIPYDNPFASLPGRTTQKKVYSDDNPFELIMPSRQTLVDIVIRQSRKAYNKPSNAFEEGVVDHDWVSRTRGIENPLMVSPMPNMKSFVLESPAVQEHDNSSESSFATDGFLTPSDHGPLKKIMLANLMGGDHKTEVDDTDPFGLESPSVPLFPSTETSNKADEESDSEIAFEFDSPFGGERSNNKTKIRSEKSRRKVIAPTGNLGDEMNRSFHDALSMDPFESQEFSPLASTKKSFSGKVISDVRSLEDEMNRSFHDALRMDPFELEELKAECFSAKTNGFRRDATSTSSDDLMEEMYQSFHDALSADPDASDSDSPAMLDVVQDPPKTREPEGLHCIDDSGLGASDPAKNSTSLSGFINKNRYNNSSSRVPTSPGSKSSKSSCRSNSLDQLKSLGRRSNSLDKLKPLGRRSNSKERLEVPNRRQTNIDDLIDFQQKKALVSSSSSLTKPWNRIRSAMSAAVSVGRRASEATKTVATNPESSSFINNASWNNDHHSTIMQQPERPRRNGTSELSSQSEHGADGTKTRLLSSGMGASKAFRSSSKETQAKRKKKKNMLGKSDHSTKSIESPPREKDVGLTASTKKPSKRGAVGASKSKKLSKSRALVSALSRESKKQQAQDLFQDFMVDRAVQPPSDEDVFSC